MASKYVVGQKVAVSPGSNQGFSVRDADLEQYAGMTGEITNCYWIRPPAGGAFYLYTVRIGTGYKEVVLYEDELEMLVK